MQELGLPEIKQLIVQQLVDDEDLRDGGCEDDLFSLLRRQIFEDNHLSLLRRQTLLSLALSCKNWFHAAIKPLWEKLDYFMHLTRTLPEDLWQWNLTESIRFTPTGSFGPRPYTSSDGLRRQLVFKREMRASDWVRFDLYACKVRVLEFDTPPLLNWVKFRDQILAFSEIPNLALDEMVEIRPAQTWFPNLDTLILNGFASDEIFECQLLNSNLRCLKVKPCLPDRLYSEDNEVRLPAFLEQAICAASSLKDLEIPSFDPRHHSDILVRLLAAHPLVRFAAHYGPLNQEVLLALSTSPRLKELACELDLGSFPSQGWLTDSGTPRFPKLADLHIKFFDLKVAIKFLPMVPKSLHTLSVATPGDWKREDAARFVDSVAANFESLHTIQLSSDGKYALHQVDELPELYERDESDESDAPDWYNRVRVPGSSQDQVGYFRDGASMVSTGGPFLRLLGLPSLRTIEIGELCVPPGYNFADFLDRLASAAPLATSVAILGLESASLYDLASFCSKLHRLESLAASVDDLSNIPKDVEEPEKVQLKKLFLPDATPSDVQHLAAYLERNCPCLEKVTGYDMEKLVIQLSPTRKLLCSWESKPAAAQSSRLAGNDTHQSITWRFMTEGD